MIAGCRVCPFGGLFVRFTFPQRILSQHNTQLCTRCSIAGNYRLCFTSRLAHFEIEIIEPLRWTVHKLMIRGLEIICFDTHRADSRESPLPEAAAVPSAGAFKAFMLNQE